LTQSNSATKVGVASLIMIVMITMLLIWKSGIMLRATGYQLEGRFNSISGLLNGAEVRYRGYKVGKVSAVDPGPEYISVKFFIKPDIRIPKGSKLRIIFDGLIGERYMAIVALEDEKEMVAQGAVLYGYATSGLADFVDVGTQNLEETKEILEALSEVLTSENVKRALANVFLKFEKVSDDLAQVTNALRGISEEGRLRQMAHDYSQLGSNLREISDGFREDVFDKEGLQKINNTIDNLEVFTRELKNFVAPPEPNGGSGGPDSASTIRPRLMRLFRDFQLRQETWVRYWNDTDNVNYLANLEVGYPETFFRVGIGDRLGNLRLMNLQQGINWPHSFTTRFGLINNEAGIGADYLLFERLKMSFDVYNINSAEYELTGKLLLLPYVDLMVSFSDKFKDPNIEKYGIGVSIHP